MSRLKKAAWTSLALILIAGIGIGVGAHLILENTALKECTDLCLQQNRYQGQTATFDACLNDVPYCVQQQGVNNDSAFWAGVALVAIGACAFRPTRCPQKNVPLLTLSLFMSKLRRRD